MDKPIGIFDSGIGGLTVVKELIKLLPNENIVYFGDTARVPYGTKSPRLIQQYSLENAEFLNQFDIKTLIVACNTASSHALAILDKHLEIPVIGVVKPGAEAAVRTSGNGHIGVIGTTATINSASYHREIRRLKAESVISGQACPLLVSLVEEGWLDNEVTVLTLQKYLAEPLRGDIDTLILGCTHYPLLSEAIQKVVGPNVRLIDSGKETARDARLVLEENNLLKMDGQPGWHRYFVSDIPAKFEEIGSMFLGQSIHHVERVDFDKFLGSVDQEKILNRIVHENS